MSQQELLGKVVTVLEDAGIEYMLSGSIVSSLQGEPRSTHDIDVVVAFRQAAAKTVIDAFPPPQYYLEESALLDALRKRSMFSLLHVDEGDKVDFWILTDDPFDQSRFSRKYVEEVFGIRIHVSTPEDTILMKLRWANLAGGSEKQFGDALRVFEVQRGKLDVGYMDMWARELNVDPLWQRLQQEAR